MLNGLWPRNWDVGKMLLCEIWRDVFMFRNDCGFEDDLLVDSLHKGH